MNHDNKIIEEVLKELIVPNNFKDKDKAFRNLKISFRNKFINKDNCYPESIINKLYFQDSNYLYL